MLWNLNTSLFSPQAISDRQNRELLLQFLISEILQAHRTYQQEGDSLLVLSPHPRLFPYDWATTPGFLNKAYEHSLLLAQCFPDHIPSVKKINNKFTETLNNSKNKTDAKLILQTLYSLIEPLIEACKTNENLLFFLLKNRETIDSLMQQGHLSKFLHRIHPNSLEILGEKMCDQYHQRGFFSQIPEFKLLLTELIHA